MNPNSALLPSRRVDPDAAFSDWLSDLDLSEESEVVYSSMFSKFSSWLERRGITLEVCDDTDIEGFLDENGLVKQHRYRYVRLIERFYFYLSAKNLLKRDNPGSRAARAGVGRGENDKTQFLAPEQYKAVAEFIARRTENSGKGEKQKPTSRHWSQFSEWREARDKALAAVMLFGAVKVSEVALLSVNCITGDRVRIKADGRVPYHEALLLPDGLASLDAWFAARSAAGIPGTVLFPSSDLGDPMHPASVYRRVHHIAETALASAGLPPFDGRLSPQTLRNTYAGMLISQGLPDQAIMESMGIKELRSIARLRAAFQENNPQ